MNPMAGMQRRRFQVACSVAVLTALAFTVAAVSAYVLWLGDDVDYGFFISDSIWDSHGRLDSFEAFLASQGNHYWHVNGRFVAHALVQLFCGVLGQEAFALCNALVYCLFVCLLARTAGVGAPMRHPLVLLCASALTLLTFVTKMMPTTQIGFVWMFAVNLLWIRCYTSPKSYSAWTVAPLFLLGLVAGNGQEALSLGVSAALVVQFLRQRMRVRPRQWWMAASYWLGTLAICLSPGTLGRASAMHVGVEQSLIYAFFALPALWLMLVVALWMKKRHGLTWRRLWHSNSLWIIVMAVMLAFNLLIGVYSNRQLFGVELAALVVMLRILPRHRFGAWGVALLTVAAALLVCVQCCAASRVRSQFQAIENQHILKNEKAVRGDRTLASDNMFLREFRYYEEIIGPFNNDTHHSLQKLIRKRNPELKTLHVWPEYMAPGYAACDTIHAYARQHYFVISTDSASDTVIAHYTMLPPFGPAVSDTVGFTRLTVRGRNWRGAIVLPARPFCRLDSVSRP